MSHGMSSARGPLFLSDMFQSDEIRSFFEAPAMLRRYLEIEVAIAEVEGSLGLIPEDAAQALANELTVDAIDMDRFHSDLENTGFPIVPLLRQVVDLVSEESAQVVHWGATTQDIMDTALVLQMREALRLFRVRISRLREVLADHADTHRSSVMLGRSQLQHALPTTFGLKAAVWLSMFQRHAMRLTQLEERLYVVQFGGAVGTLAALGTAGLTVRDALAARLELGVAPTAWHTTRDSLAEVVSYLANLTASLGKIGQDILLLAQSDVGEVRERLTPGRGVSSTMPQKRNPISAQQITVVASSVADLSGAMFRASVHDHERASGNWMKEWTVIPEAFVVTGKALDLTIDLLEGLEVDIDRMRSNVEADEFIMAEAVMMALAPHLGRAGAHEIIATAVETAVDSNKSFHIALAEIPAVTDHLSDVEIEHLLAPHNYLGSSIEMIDQTLAGEEPSQEEEPGRETR